MEGIDVQHNELFLLESHFIKRKGKRIRGNIGE